MIRLACGLGISLAMASGLAAQSGGRPLAIEDYYRVRAIGTHALSPDGKRVAYTVVSRTEANNIDSSAVFLVPVSGGAPPVQVSAQGTHALRPRWTAEGRLRFSVRGSEWEYDPEGSLPAAEVPGARGDSSATRVESPGGKWVAVLRNVTPGPLPRAPLSDFEQRHETRFRGRQFDWLRFQRDGADYPTPNSADPRVNPAREIFLSAMDGSWERQLTTLGLRPQSIAWTPDASRIVFTADSSYRDERRYEHGQVWSVTPEGEVRRLSNDPDSDYGEEAVSPDGRWVLATRQISTDAVIAKRMDNGGPTDLVLIPAAGGAERNLTADWDYLPTAARWSADGKSVWFSGGIGGSIHLFRVPVEGGPVRQVTTGERRIGGTSFDRDQRHMAYTVGTMEAPSELWVSDTDGKNERRLTAINEELLREVKLSAPERLRFTSKDGTPVEGWLYRPYGYRAGAGRWPLVVFSHGGPHSATGYGFDFKLQYFAAQGYFVLATNFRGSTGYGEKFLWGSWGGWGNKDGEDVMAGVDYVISQNPIDPRRVATVGHSYGGFMSNWLITQYPDRFAAAAVGAGIVNWVSDYGTADIARTKETEFFGTPWDPAARELMMRQSPLTYANRARAATLFINGEVDERVPYSEAEQMFVALRKNGVPAKIIQYAGQPHGIAGSWNNVHRILNERRWLDTWLKPGEPKTP